MDQHAGGPALFVYAFGFQYLFQQADLVVGIQNGEAGFQADQFSMFAQDAGAQCVEGSQPHPLCRRANQMGDALAHFLGGLVGEGDAQDLIGLGLALMQNLRKPGGQHAGLAGASPCQYQNGSVNYLHRQALGIVQSVQPGRRRGIAAPRIGGGWAAGHSGEVDIVVIQWV